MLGTGTMVFLNLSSLIWSEGIAQVSCFYFILLPLEDHKTIVYNFQRPFVWIRDIEAYDEWVAEELGNVTGKKLLRKFISKST